MVLRITSPGDGPLRVEGEAFTLVDAAGNRYDLAGRTAVSLCRCGQSQNNSFCDGSHVKVGFAAETPPSPFRHPPPSSDALAPAYHPCIDARGVSRRSSGALEPSRQR